MVRKRGRYGVTNRTLLTEWVLSSSLGEKTWVASEPYPSNALSRKPVMRNASATQSGRRIKVRSRCKKRARVSFRRLVIDDKVGILGRGSWL